jgi:hypothetical protein
MGVASDALRVRGRLITEEIHMVGRPACSALVVLVGTLVGCGGEGSEPEADLSPAGVTESTKTPGEPSTTSGDVPTVVILDQGSRPRRLLELDVEEGHTEASTLEMVLTQRVQGETVVVPPISFLFTSTVESVDADQIEVSQSYDSVRVKGRGHDPQVVRQMRAAIEPLVGVTGTTWLTRGGAPLRTEFDIADDAPPAMRSMLEELGNQAGTMSVPYPNQEVGPGARWEATTEIEVNGIALEQLATYSLKSFDGDGFRMAIEIQQHFLPESAAAGVEMVSGEGEMTGMIRGSTETLMPLRSTVRGATALVIEANGQRVRTVTKPTINASTRVR